MGLKDQGFILGIHNAQANNDQEDELKKLVDINPEDDTMHLFSEPGKEKSLSLVSFLPWVQEHDVVRSEENVEENHEWIKREDEKREEVKEDPPSYAQLPVVGSIDFLREKILIERMTHKLLVIVPKSCVPSLKSLLRVVNRWSFELKKSPDILHTLAVLQQISGKLFTHLQKRK